MGMSLKMRDRMWGSYVVRFSRGDQVRSLDRSRDERERSGSAEGKINISKARGHRRGQKNGRKEEKRLYSSGSGSGHWTADSGHKGGADEPRVGNPSKSGASPGATAGCLFYLPDSPIASGKKERDPRIIGAGMVAIYDIHGIWIVTVRGMLDRYAHDQLTNPTPADYEMCDLAG
ncbi:hypothetical protein BDW72DRAFT_203227 [Aspergillus terricola var. indicus]